ncbi:MAG: hypothetical protein AAFZ07_21255 [Actinomycetota bacterium]
MHAHAVPNQVSDIDVGWLNEVTPDDVGEVTALDARDLGTGVGILGEVARLHLTYAPGHDGPATMIAKCASPSPESVGLATAMGFYERELSFYRETAATLTDVRVPRPYHVDAAAGSVPFVLLLEDIVGARCPDQIAGLTVDEAGAILDAVAGLHAAFWESPALDELTWLPPMNNDLYKGAGALAEARWDGFVEVWGSRVPATMLAAVEQVIPRYPRLLDWWVEQGHATFAHTDCRAENYLFGGADGDDAVTVVDFQLSTRHVGAWDVANLLGGSLRVDVRREAEEGLVARYHARLVELGVTHYPIDRLWRDIEMSWLQQSFAAVAVSDLEGGNARGDELLAELFTRPFVAAADHGVERLLSEL